MEKAKEKTKECINGSKGKKSEEVRLIEEKSYEGLENDFMPLIISAARHYRGLAEWDDLMQEARIAFYQGVMEFDTEGEVYFAYYIKKKIYGALRTYSRRMARESERELLLVNQPIEELEGEVTDYLDSLVEQAKGSGLAVGVGVALGQESDADYICDRLDLEALIQRAGLTELEAYIIEEIYYQGASQADLARSLAVSSGRLYYYLQEALARLRFYLEENLQV